MTNWKKQETIARLRVHGRFGSSTGQIMRDMHPTIIGPTRHLRDQFVAFLTLVEATVPEHMRIPLRGERLDKRIPTVCLMTALRMGIPTALIVDKYVELFMPEYVTSGGNGDPDG